MKICVYHTVTASHYCIVVTVSLVQMRTMRLRTLFKATLLANDRIGIGTNSKEIFFCPLFPLMLNNGHVWHWQSENIKCYNIIFRTEYRNCHPWLSPLRWLECYALHHGTAAPLTSTHGVFWLLPHARFLPVLYFTSPTLNKEPFYNSLKCTVSVQRYHHNSQLLSLLLCTFHW